MSDRTSASASAPNFLKFAPSASFGFGRIFYIKFGKYRRFLIASVSDFKSHEPRIVCITEFEKWWIHKPLRGKAVYPTSRSKSNYDYHEFCWGSLYLTTNFQNYIEIIHLIHLVYTKLGYTLTLSEIIHLKLVSDRTSASAEYFLKASAEVRLRPNV